MYYTMADILVAVSLVSCLQFNCSNLLQSSTQTFTKSTPMVDTVEENVVLCSVVIPTNCILASRHYIDFPFNPSCSCNVNCSILQCPAIWYKPTFYWLPARPTTHSRSSTSSTSTTISSHISAAHSTNTKKEKASNNWISAFWQIVVAALAFIFIALLLYILCRKGKITPQQQQAIVLSPPPYTQQNPALNSNTMFNYDPQYASITDGDDDIIEDDENDDDPPDFNTALYDLATVHQHPEELSPSLVVNQYEFPTPLYHTASSN